MFVGRERELADLNRSYNGGRFQMLVLYGRRRVGKTTLIAEFTKDKPTVFFSAQDSTTSYNLSRLAEQLLRFHGISTDLRFPDWASLFDFISDPPTDQRLVLVLDEFPYLAQRDPSILTALQHAIDHRWKDSNLYLVLCGSTMSFMENEVLGSRSPLFGRRTLQIHLKPLQHDSVASFAPRYPASERAVVYGILGGTPHYLNLLDPDVTLAENIQTLFLSSSAYLFDEPILLMKQEMREPAVYNAILHALAEGASKRNDVVTRCGEDTDKVGKYLSVLMTLGLVDRTTPFGEKESARNSLYRLKEPLFRFWFRFVFPYRGLIDQGHGAAVLESRILPYLNDYMGGIFEEICGEHVLLNNGSDRFRNELFLEMGKWWGNDPLAKSQAEIDLVAISQRKALFGECKWTETAFPVKAYQKLVQRHELVGSAKGMEPMYALFAKKGCDAGLREIAAKDANVLLFNVDEMM